ncbi:MAG: HlyC/CorC family transporter [Desulfobacterales bacterium]|nr:MAG: HlyC/CorC family transporter [Desulfobacterales bacterium]
MVDQIILLIALLLLSGFFSSAETALFSISKTKARHLAKQDVKSFKLIRKMKENPHKLLTTILIGNNIVNVGAAAMATSITITIFPNYAVGIATGVMTFLILVFGEVLPKSFATQNNILIARIVIYPIYWISILLFPAVKFLNFIPRLTGRIKKTPAVTEEELITFVEVVEEEGEIKEEEKDLIHKIFEFDDTNASEIMTPRTDMFVIEAGKELQLEQIVNSGFTRIPVIEGTIDNIIGIINIKDLFLQKINAVTTIDVRTIMTRPDFVPENKKLDKLLKQFKETKHHMAIVVDEYGGVSGLITLEDALEEIVGEIRDESDKEEPHIVKVQSKEWMVLGKSDIDEVNETTGMDIPDSKEYDTFSGYILNAIGRIPKEKEAITIGAYTITVEEIDGNRITEYSIKQK